MKYCKYCGNQLADEAIICVKCGRMVNDQPAPPPYQPVQQKSSMNVICLLGFIFSFISSVVGLILSIIGYNQVKNTPDTSSKTFAKAGIIISSVMIGISVLAVILVLMFYGILFGLIFY